MNLLHTDESIPTQITLSSRRFWRVVGCSRCSSLFSTLSNQIRFFPFFFNISKTPFSFYFVPLLRTKCFVVKFRCAGGARSCLLSFGLSSSCPLLAFEDAVRVTVSKVFSHCFDFFAKTFGSFSVSGNCFFSSNLFFL